MHEVRGANDRKISRRVIGRFKYERRPIEARPEEDVHPNPYHGNLLMLNDLDKNAKKNIQHSLATLAGSIIKRESE